LIEGMIMKPGEGVCCMFLLAISGFTLHKIWQNTKGGYIFSYN